MGGIGRLPLLRQEEDSGSELEVPANIPPFRTFLHSEDPHQMKKDELTAKKIIADFRENVKDSPKSYPNLTYVNSRCDLIVRCEMCLPWVKRRS
jgi:hypothetical protein